VNAERQNQDPPDSEVAEGQRAHAVSSEPSEIIYDELPEGLLDVRTAAQKYGVLAANISMWMNRGRIPCLGRLRAPAVGGGFKVTSEAAIESYMDSPKNKGGRPKKTC